MNWEQIFREHHVPYRLPGQHRHVSGAFVGTDCPRCGRGAGKFKLGFSLTGNYSICWSCGPIRPAEALHELTGLPIKECWNLAGGVDFGKLKEWKKGGVLEVPKGVKPLGIVHRRYLAGRGFEPEEIERLWGVKGICQAAQHAWTLYIPVHHRGEVVSWTTRELHDKGGRYCNARPEQERMPIKSVLFGLDYVRHTAVVVEGPTDVWRIGPGAVATMGVGYSKAQLAALSKIPERYVCFDNEPNAQRRARRLADSLSVFEGRTHLMTLEAADAGSASRREIGAIRRILGQ